MLGNLKEVKYSALSLTNFNFKLFIQVFMLCVDVDLTSTLRPVTLRLFLIRYTSDLHCTRTNINIHVEENMPPALW